MRIKSTSTAKEGNKLIWWVLGDEVALLGALFLLFRMRVQRQQMIRGAAVHIGVGGGGRR